MSLRTEKTEDALLEIGKWTDGVVNARPGNDIPMTGLQDAQNIDLTEKGNARRRKGSTLVLSLTNGKSCYADRNYLYSIDGTTMNASSFVNGVWTTNPIATGIDASALMYWTQAQGSTWFSNGIQNGKIVGGAVIPFSVEMPPAAPTLAAGSGNLQYGTYAVILTYITSAGEESGATNRVSISMPPPTKNADTQGQDLSPVLGIMVTGIPTPATPQIAYVRVYVSEPNGTVLYKYADLPAGTDSVLITRSRTKGVYLINEFTEQFPVCNHIHAWRGFMLGADPVNANILWHSEPQRFGAAHLESNFIVFPTPITMVAPVDDGFYVADQEKTYFIAGGEPDKWSLREVLPYGGAVPGTYWRNPDRVEAGWFSEKGQIVARDGGDIKNVTIERIAPDAYAVGASMFRREDGVEQIVNTFPQAGQPNAMVAQSYFTASVIRAKVS